MRPLARSLAPVPVVMFACLAVWSGCSHQDPLAALLPDVAPEVRAVLARGDVEAAADLAAARGHWAATRTYEQLRDVLVRDRTAVLPLLAVWGEAVARAYELPEYRRDAAFWRATDGDRTGRLVARWREVRHDLATGDLPPDSVRVRLADHAAAFRAAGDRFGTARTEYDLGNLCLKLGRVDEARDRFATLLDDGRRWQLTAETCDALNSLALFALVADDTAGADYLAEVLTRARRSRLAARAGRALTIAGMHARREGGFARSMDLLEEAVTVCGELGESWQGLPYLIYLMRFHAGLDDWRQVSQLVPRAEVLLREARRAEADPLLLQREGARLRELQLRLDIHEGRVAAALAAYPALLDDARRQPFAEVTYIHDRQVRALLACGRPDAALAVLPAALEQAEAAMRPETLSLLLARAEANLALGRLADADLALDRFDEVAADREGWAGALQVDALALRALLHHRCGEPTAPARLRDGLALLAADLAASDASSLAYVELQRHRLLRQALREIVGHDPHTALGVELVWRDLPAQLGVPGRPPAVTVDPVAAAREAALRRHRALTADQMHLLYVEVGDRIARWQLTPMVITCDTLAVTASGLHERIGALLAELADDPGDPSAPVPTSLARRAEALAVDLLPAAVREGPRPRQLLIAPERALAQLPFGVLDLQAGDGYLPVALACDVVRVRGTAGRPARREPGHSWRALVVSDPQLTDRLRRRHPGLAELSAAVTDRSEILAMMPDATVLAGDRATLPGVQRVWEEADLLYFACHTVRSPESPFRTFLPLSPAAAGSPLTAPYLDVGAIRTADLADCRLVVLASCASGAPYVSGRACAPSLGDAFLDAGAGAVLQTLWRVRDEDAARLPIRFLQHYPAGNGGPQLALAAARREVMTGPDGSVRHPFGWAAYVLELRGF